LGFSPFSALTFFHLFVSLICSLALAKAPLLNNPYFFPLLCKESSAFALVPVYELPTVSKANVSLVNVSAFLPNMPLIRPKGVKLKKELPKIAS